MSRPSLSITHIREMMPKGLKEGAVAASHGQPVENVSDISNKGFYGILAATSALLLSC